MNTIVPLISSGVAGPLGVLHLPRLWLKLSLESTGKLAPGYPGAGKGYDQMVIDGIGLNRDAVIDYVSKSKPTYCQFEAWVKKNATKLVKDWGQLPAGMRFGLGCGVVVDSKDRVYVTSRSTNPSVAVFDRHGKLLETWSSDFAEKVGYTPEQVKDTAHCIYWSKEGKSEFLYFTENVSTNKEGRKLGKRVYKTDLHGKILYVIGNVDQEGSTCQKFEWT